MSTRLRPLRMFPPVAALIDLAIAVYYAFFVWRAKPEVPVGAMAFTYHRRSMDRYAVGLLAFLSLVEAAVGHVVIRRWSIDAAWVLTDLSVLGVFYLIAAIRAFTLRPVLLDEASIALRLGLLRSATVALADIRRVERIDGTPDRAKDLQRLCLVQPANLMITTASSRIACYVDDPEELARAIGKFTGRTSDKSLSLVSNETISGGRTP